MINIDLLINVKTNFRQLILGKTTWPCILHISTFILLSIVQPAKFNTDEGADDGAPQKFLAEQKVYMKYKP